MRLLPVLVALVAIIACATRAPAQQPNTNFAALNINGPAGSNIPVPLVANTFTDYFRLMIMHLGLPHWFALV